MIKISIIHTNKKNQLVLNTKNFESFLQRIAKDDARGTITNFRNSKEVLDYGYESYRGMANWRHVYPSAEYGKEANDCLKLKTVNGILLLTFDDIFEAEDMAALKRSASLMPSTFAVIEGADGTSAHVLVRYTDIDGEIPQNEEDAEELHRMAAKQIVPLYQTLIKEDLQPTSHSLKDNFLMTLDAHPYYNAQAIPMKIDHLVRKQEMIKGGVKEVKKFPTPDLVGWETDDGEIEKSKVGVQPTTADNIMNMMVFLRDRYDFRYNVLMKYTEYKTKGRGWQRPHPGVGSHGADRQSVLGRLVLHLVFGHGGPMAWHQPSIVWQQCGAAAHLETRFQQEYFLSPLDSARTAMGLYRQLGSVRKTSSISGDGSNALDQPG